MKRKLLSLFLGITIAASFVIVPVDAASDHTYYSQKGWTYNNVKLNSMCFCASIAMSLSDLGVKVSPLDIYINNGKTAYCKGNEVTAKDFGVNWKLVYLEKNGVWSAEKNRQK